MGKMPEVYFFDEKGKAQLADGTQDETALSGEDSTQDTVIAEGSGEYAADNPFRAEYKICHIKGMPDVKTETVYRTYKVFGKKVRVPTIAVRKRRCDTDYVAIFRLQSEQLIPIVVQCSVAAAVIAAPIIIGGAATGVAAPAALAAGLEAFAQSVAACLAIKGYDRKVFDVKLEQRKSCTAWEPVA